MSHNEFRIDDVMPESALLLDDVAVFSGGDWLCATQAACTHRGGLLSDGHLDGSTVTCPLHGAQFDVCTGAVLRGPARDSLQTYTVIVEGDTARIEDDQ